MTSYALRISDWSSDVCSSDLCPQPSCLDPPMQDAIKPSVNAFSAKGNWTREQTLLAFQFYCETPFGQLHGRNKKVIELAGLIGRTPDAVAMKCVNIASLDPKVRARGRSVLQEIGRAHV